MKNIALVLTVLLAAAPSRAAFDDMGAGARAPGLGDAFTALADDAYAIHYNPAGLAQLERPMFGVAHAKLYSGLSDGSDIGSSQLAYAHPLSRGKQGALGFSWERLSLSGLYQEQALAFAYARQVLGKDGGGRLFAGGSVKYLTRSFSRGAEASNACSGLNCSLGADPVLSGATSKSVPDIDLGLVYRFPRRFQAGLALQHALAPNVAFSGVDKLERAVNAGLAYKSLWMSLAGELKLRRAADGSMGKDAIFAAERYFPTLDRGQFALRGSLGLGSADWRQFTVGGSYRINKIQADYAYLIPVSGVKGASGSHRVGLSFHFGAPAPDEQLAQDLLEQRSRAKDGLPAVSTAPGFGYEYAEQARPQDLSDPRLDPVRALINQRRYRAAKQSYDALAKVQPLGAGLERLGTRLDDAAYHYAELPEPASRQDQAVVAALSSYLNGDDRVALLHAAYALALSGRDARVESLLQTLEAKTGLKADRLPEGHPRGFIDELLWRVEYAHTRGDKDAVESLLADVLRLEPGNMTALERLGSQRYLSGRYLEAIQAWEAAEKIETRERELVSLRAYLKLAREAASGKAMPGGLAPAAVEPPAPRIERRELPRRPAPAPSGDPREVEGLYQKGVEHYARGEYLQASSAFLRILRIDPNNAPARKALDRIDRARPAK